MPSPYPRHAQICSTSPTVSDTDVVSFAGALNLFLQQTFGPAWDMQCFAEAATIQNPPPAGTVPLDPSKYVTYLVDGQGPAGIGGQHFHSNGQSYAEVYLGSVGTAWPELAAHETEETIVNPLNNATVETPGQHNYICALEVCDAVEHNPIYVTSPVDGRAWPMENFCTPEWFVADGVPPYDALNMLHSPLTPQPGGRMPS